jgi:OPT family oligopeptide transporter
MAPDRGELDPEQAVERSSSSRQSRRRVDSVQDGHHFTVRGVLVGLVIGVIICFSNMYFGLQTGWISGMAMPSALLGFSYFKLVNRFIDYPFTPVENVLVQSVAGSVGTMPLGCGFVGVIPALNFLLKPEENGPLDISLTKLIIWALGIAFFGVVFAVPLRKQVIIKEKLKFPSGTAAAALINLLHGKSTSTPDGGKVDVQNEELEVRRSSASEEHVEEAEALLNPASGGSFNTKDQDPDLWRARIKFLLWAFIFSSVYVSSALLWWSSLTC